MSASESPPPEGSRQITLEELYVLLDLDTTSGRPMTQEEIDLCTRAREAPGGVLDLPPKK